ncbi:MAG: hypothetical protein IT285_14065 [Bdellovibrionales bacterium]|nr:hypothetical protein [Bdellovibrionales bacterium]
MNTKFKRFLTLQFASSFDRACTTVTLPPRDQEELLRLSRQMMHHLSVAHHARTVEDEAKALFVSLTYLRDTRELLDRFGVGAGPAREYWVKLHDRLETHCLEVAGGEDGQLRMLG